MLNVNFFVARLVLEESLKCPTKVKISKKILHFFLLEISLVCLGASPDIIGKIS